MYFNLLSRPLFRWLAAIAAILTMILMIWATPDEQAQHTFQARNSEIQIVESPMSEQPIQELLITVERPSMYAVLQPLYGDFLNANQAINQMVVLRSDVAGCFVFHDPKAWGMAAGAIYLQLQMLQVGDQVTIYKNTATVDTEGCTELRLFEETFEKDRFWTVFEEVVDGATTYYRFTPGAAYFQVQSVDGWTTVEPYQQ